MRFAFLLTMIAVAGFGLTFSAPEAEAVGICTYGDVYNNMGGPGSRCQGVVCIGYSGGYWQSCVWRDPICSNHCPPPAIDPWP